jgi:hypothetical protein
MLEVEETRGGNGYACDDQEYRGASGLAAYNLPCQKNLQVIMHAIEQVSASTGGK